MYEAQKRFVLAPMPGTAMQVHDWLNSSTTEFAECISLKQQETAPRVHSVLVDSTAVHPA